MFGQCQNVWSIKMSWLVYIVNVHVQYYGAVIASVIVLNIQVYSAYHTEAELLHHNWGEPERA